MYDYLIVGAGLFGAVFAHEATSKGKSVLVIDKNTNVAGNCYTENRDGINLHMHGPHIFHTNSEEIWNYVNQFAKFRQYKQATKALYNDKLYNLPINLNTIMQVWPEVRTPEEAKKLIQTVKIPFEHPTNLEEWAKSQIGTRLYDMFIKEYTTKQWGKDPTELPASIIKRLPIRYSFDDNYYNHVYQGIPIGGYTNMISNMLERSTLVLGTDFFTHHYELSKLAKKVVYTGPIDKLFNYCYGNLEYRSLEFKHELVPIEDAQGCAIVNYPELKYEYTRQVEHKHFEGTKSQVSWITKEYPLPHVGNNTPYYPIGDIKNNKLYNRYQEIAKTMPRYILGGRLAEYKYYDMDQVVGSALAKASKELKQ